jgi:hypothetical protein
MTPTAADSLLQERARRLGLWGRGIYVRTNDVEALIEQHLASARTRRTD